MRKSKHGGTLICLPSLSVMGTYGFGIESQPHALCRPVSRWCRRSSLMSWTGLSWVPPDCAAIVYRWLGNEGPWADAKKSSPRTNRLAQCQ